MKLLDKKQSQLDENQNIFEKKKIIKHYFLLKNHLIIVWKLLLTILKNLNLLKN